MYATHIPGNWNLESNAKLNIGTLHVTWKSQEAMREHGIFTCYFLPKPKETAWKNVALELEWVLVGPKLIDMIPFVLFTGYLQNTEF